MGWLLNFKNAFGNEIFINKNKHKFLSKLLLSFWALIIICILIMGIVSYKFVSDNMKQHSINANNELINRVKSKYDDILKSIDILSQNIMLDMNTNPVFSFLNNNQMENSKIEMLKIKEYLGNYKSINYDLDMFGIFFPDNKLLVTSKFIRYNPADDKTYVFNGEYQYYEKLIDNMIYNKKSVSWIADNNYPFSNDNVIIHFLRKNVGLNDEVIFISFNTSQLCDVLRTIEPDLYKNIILIDENGTVLYSHNKECMGKNIEFTEFGLSINNINKNSGWFLKTIKETKTVVSFVRSDQNDWIYIAMTPMYKISGQVSYLIKILIITSILTIVTAFLVAFLMAKKISIPIQNIVRLFNNMFEGKEKKDELALIYETLIKINEKITLQDYKIKQYFPILKSNLIIDIINKNIVNEKEILRRFSLLGIKFEYELFIPVVIEINMQNIDYTRYEFKKIEFVNMLEENLTSESMKCIGTHSEDLILLILNSGDFGGNKIKDMCNEINNVINNSFNFIVGVGSISNSLKTLGESFTDARNMLKYKYFKFDEKYFIYNEIISIIDGNKIDESLIASVRKNINNYDIDESLKSIKNIINELKFKYYEYNLGVQQLFNILNILMNFIIKNNISLCEIGIEDCSDFEHIFDDTKNIDEFGSRVIEYIKKIFNILNLRKDNRYYELINEAKTYICNNIGDINLSLKAVADYFNISPNYFSKIFRDVTGMTFSNFVNSEKIKLAKKLLLESDYNLEEISKKLAYSSSKYLINKFKANVGLTPNEYRKMIQQ